MPNFIKSFARSMAVGRVSYCAVDQKYEASFDAIDSAKRSRVAVLSNRIGVHRVDYLGVAFTDSYIDFHWVPGSN